MNSLLYEIPVFEMHFNIFLNISLTLLTFHQYEPFFHFELYILHLDYSAFWI